MKKVKSILYLSVTLILLGYLFCCSCTEEIKDDPHSLLIKITNGIMNDTNFDFIDHASNKIYYKLDEIPSDAEVTLRSPYNDWKYWNGVMNIGFLRLSEYTSDNTYENFVERNMAFAFDNYKFFEKKYNGENKWTFPLAQLFVMEELDDCGAMGASLIEIYKRDPKPEYKEYLKKAANHISNVQQRLEDGSLVRKFPSEWTIWADDLYMGISFLSRYGEFTGDTKYFDDASKQIINYHKYVFNESKELMCHNWYSDIQQPGVAYWGRANGWAMMAQIDLLERLPEEYALADTLKVLLYKHIIGLSKYQDPTGLWHQLLDKPDSYLETSCSAMFVYTISRAVNKGIIDQRYASIAKTGWEGLKKTIDKEGLVHGVCAGTIVYDELKPYYERPTPVNDIHGLGAVILAGTEILKLSE